MPTKYFCECGHRMIYIETVWLHYHRNSITKNCQMCECKCPRVGNKIEGNYEHYKR